MAVFKYPMSSRPKVIADIGVTHTRFALLRSTGNIQQEHVLQTDKYPY